MQQVEFVNLIDVSLNGLSNRKSSASSYQNKTDKILANGKRKEGDRSI